jgi:ABC-2 type transport system permease protein
LRTITPIAARKHSLLRSMVNNRPDEGEEEEAPAESEPTAAADAADRVSLEDKVYMVLVPGFTVMFVFFLINIMARSFIAERDQGTLRRLKLAPIDSVSILIGKTLPFYLTSVVQTSLLFLCGKALFQMPWGPEPIYLIPVILCTSLAATSLGLLLATLVHTDQQVSSFGTSIVLVLGGISGCMFPRLWLPELMKKISLFTPHAWSLEAFDAVLTHKAVDSMLVFDCCLALLAFAAVFFLCGWWRFRVAN